jgi:hypothetical protein
VYEKFSPTGSGMMGRMNVKHLASQTARNQKLDRNLVASSGIEPELSALRGRRVNQLHHDATRGPKERSR